MFKHEGFKAGQTIKAFDFEPMPDRGDCFIEGKIVQVHTNGTVRQPFAHYIVQVTRDVFTGEEIVDNTARVGKTYAIPMELSMMEFDGRITEVK